jgi:hypothetical protein
MKKPPAPPRRSDIKPGGLTMPAKVLDLIHERGIVAVFIPAPEGIRFFVVQNLSEDEAEEFATILEDCAKTVRGMYRPTPGRVQ